MRNFGPPKTGPVPCEWTPAQAARIAAALRRTAAPTLSEEIVGTGGRVVAWMLVVTLCFVAVLWAAGAFS